MPTYVYQVILGDGETGQIFEVDQKMSDPPLTEHPTTGQPVKRIIQTPYLGGKYSEGSIKANVSDKNAQQKGFTKYVRSGDGTYEKRTGDGPDVISAND